MAKQKIKIWENWETRCQPWLYTCHSTRIRLRSRHLMRKWFSLPMSKRLVLVIQLNHWRALLIMRKWTTLWRKLLRRSKRKFRFKKFGNRKRIKVNKNQIKNFPRKKKPLKKSLTWRKWPSQKLWNSARKKLLKRNRPLTSRNKRRMKRDKRLRS